MIAISLLARKEADVSRSCVSPILPSPLPQIPHCLGVSAVKPSYLILSLAASLLAAPCWAGTSSGISLSTNALSFNGSKGNVSSQPLTITATASSVTIRRDFFSTAVFSTPTALPVKLSKGQTLTLRVVAQPESSASQATLTIYTNTGHARVALSETATQPVTSHAASLKWSAPSSTPVAVDSYEIERAPTGSTQYAEVGTTTAASMAWTDSSVQSGHSYAYQVVAVGADGVASKPSNTITLSIP